MLNRTKDEDTGQYLARLFEQGFSEEETWRIENLVADHFMDHGPYVGGVDSGSGSRPSGRSSPMPPSTWRR